MNNFKVGDKVIKIKEGALDWESKDYSEGLKMGGEYIVESVINGRSITVQESIYAISFFHFKLAKHMKNNIQILVNGKQIKISEETAKELEKQFSPKKGLWKPEKGEEYYYITEYGDVLSAIWREAQYEKEFLAIGNCFRTREQAEQEVAKRKAIQSVKIYIAENFPFEPDWENEPQEKWTVYYRFDRKRFDTECNETAKGYSPFGYLKSDEDCEQLIKDMEAELKIIWEI